ncbi:MAG: SRPBCC family protein [Bacteroidota bacterium]|nr:SRPBCC family protein [Bacteroidota bacterium]
MNILKKIGIGLLILVVVLVVISLFLPAKVHIERSVVINAPVKTVYNTVNNLKSWINWSYWDQIDPNMISRFEGPESGVGAIHRWESEHELVGNGSMTFTETAEPNKILTSFEFDQTWITPGGWLFEEVQGGSKATVFMDMEMPFYARIPGMFMDGKLGADFDKTLAGLKNYTESLPIASASSWTVETITTTPAPVMCMKVTSNGAEFAAKLGNSYEKIITVMGKQGLKQSGPMYAVYHKWSPDTVEMEPGVMVDKAGKTEGDVLATEMKSVKAIKVDYYGDYPGTEKAHYFMDEWARHNQVTIIGAPWEEYVTETKSEPDTAKWLTRIYYPVQ